MLFFSFGFKFLECWRVEWTGSTITSARYAVIYDDDLTNKPLICAIDFGGDFSTTSGTFKITWNASGIFTLDLTP